MEFSPEIQAAFEQCIKEHDFNEVLEWLSAEGVLTDSFDRMRDAPSYQRMILWNYVELSKDRTTGLIFGADTQAFASVLHMGCWCLRVGKTGCYGVVAQSKEYVVQQLQSFLESSRRKILGRSSAYPAACAGIARRVFAAVANQCESFDGGVGEQLAYLLGSILEADPDRKFIGLQVNDAGARNILLALRGLPEAWPWIRLLTDAGVPLSTDVQERLLRGLNLRTEPDTDPWIRLMSQAP